VTTNAENPTHATPTVLVVGASHSSDAVLKAVRAERLARRVAIVMAEDTELSAKVVILDPTGRVLVLKDAWSQWNDLPGGHIHDNEDVITGLAREVREETGISIGDIKTGETTTLKLGKKNRPVQFFKATALSHDVRLSHEHESFEWVRPEDLDHFNLGVLLAPAKRTLDPVNIQAQDASVSHHETARRAAERIYKAAADNWLAQLHADLLAAVFGHKGSDYDGVWMAVYGAAAGGWIAVMDQAAQRAYQVTATTLANDAGVEAYQPPSPERRESFARARRQPLARFPESVRDRVIASLKRGMANGEDKRALGRRLDEAFGEVTTRDIPRVAATEAQVCYGVSQQEALELAGYRLKVWVTVGDDRVRDSHFLCEEQGAVPASAPFHNGLMFPGDPNGPPEEVINCRCNLEGAGLIRAKEFDEKDHLRQQKGNEHGGQFTKQQAPVVVPPLKPLDLNTMTKVGGSLGGSCPGAQYKDAEGVVWYIKTTKSESHAKNELLAARLYNAAGVLTPELQLVKGAPNNMLIASRLVKTVGPANGATAGAEHGFAMDALLANWDVVGASNDNLLTDAHGHAVRIDMGGSLLFRAKGGEKGEAFGMDAEEINTLRDPNGKNTMSPRCSAR
jgi:8-oxo-dGTP pyrophosphatase MutT (NUDIX family)